MKCTPLVCSALLFFVLAPAAHPQIGGNFGFDEVIQVRIDHADRIAQLRIDALGADITGVRGTTVLANVSPAILADLERLGFHVSVIPDPLVLNPGLRADYHTFAELTAELQSIAAAHPNICSLTSIGDSVQGRELWFMKISDNVDAEEDEPEFKYISSMHGNEPVGMELCLNLINLLVDEYGTDPQITGLVDEVEIWIMPLMNPDGYVNHSRYNAQGVDLNRNFPDRVKDPNNTTTGRAVETKHVMNWAFGRSSILSANFHTGALVVNYPYDSDPNPWASYSATPDDALIIEQSLTYSSLNIPMYNSPTFSQGITNGIAWYLIYGGMQDWNYVWMGCNEVTVELSNTSWPSYNKIAGLWDDNRDSMLAYMEWCLRGVRGVVTDSVTGLPVEAAVRVTGIDHDVFTDPDVGDFHRMLLPGTYTLEFTAAGYQPKTVTNVSVGTGSATVVDAVLIPEGGSDPIPDLKVNGSDGPITISPADTLRVTAALDPGNLGGVAMDWWVFVDTPQGYYSFMPAGSRWIKVSAPQRTHDGALFNLPPRQILNTSGIPVGAYTFTFAVDALDNVFQGTYSDTAQVTIQ
jgi:carboxypeptidase D